MSHIIFGRAEQSLGLIVCEVIDDLIYLQIFILCALAIFVVGLLAKFVKWSRMPPHLRWELYPVPHEPSHEHGGSYYEDSSWWKKPRTTVASEEMKELMGEMLFIKRIWKQKRSFWYLSYSFHVGTYFLIGWMALLLIGAVFGTSNTILSYLVGATGWIGIVSMTVGAVALLVARVSKAEMRNYATKADILDLVFSTAVAVSGLLAWSLDPSFSSAKSFVSSLITLQSFNPIWPITVNLILIGFFVAYVPYTRMSHFIGKYFTYHKVLWDDTPSDIKKPSEKVLEHLKEPITWSAPHLSPGKDWIENVKERGSQS